MEKTMVTKVISELKSISGLKIFPETGPLLLYKILNPPGNAISFTTLQDWKLEMPFINYISRITSENALSGLKWDS